MNAYDIVIIGGGSAGLTAADTALVYGKKIALVAKDRLGGDCLWTGCVPSKALIAKAKQGSVAWSDVRQAISAAQGHIQSAHENAEYYNQKGVDTYFGLASFVDAHTVKVGDVVVRSKFFLIATGSRSGIPAIEGLEHINYVTNETIFEMDHLPASMIVLGGGPIGCEMAQAFGRLGSSVTIVQRNERLLPKDEVAASELIAKRFEEEGVAVCLNSTPQRVRKDGKEVVLTVLENGTEREVRGEVLLVSVGRVPNTENLGLEKVGVKVDKKGILHDGELKTSQRNIYVAGDVAGDFVFTHFAARQAAAAVQNMALPFDTDFLPVSVPWVTFTDPEVAAVGVRMVGSGVRLASFEYSGIDRAVAEGKTEGFIHLYLKNDRIVGAQIVGERAGELIQEVSLAIECGISIGKVMGMIHAYPTYSSGIQQALFEDLARGESWKLKIGRWLARFT